MPNVLHTKATVLPGGRIEIVNSELHEGELVDVVVRYYDEPTRHTAVEVLAQAPGQRIFTTSDDVDLYLKEERTSWGS